MGPARGAYPTTTALATPWRPTLDNELIRYYSCRAPEYDEIYAKPERQADLAEIRAHLRDRFRGHDVLEVAAGTGYWTEVIAGVARSVLATDLSREVLELARERCGETVEIALADAYDLAAVEGAFTAAFAGFFVSHVPRRRLPAFLDGLHRRLGPGALVVLLDNRFVEGSSTPIAGVDADGDTFQERRLKDGSVRRVLKNFPDEDELRAAVAGTADDVNVRLWPYYWTLEYRTGT